jgi:hypothetical protein
MLLEIIFTVFRNQASILGRSDNDSSCFPFLYFYNDIFCGNILVSFTCIHHLNTFHYLVSLFFSFNFIHLIILSFICKKVAISFTRIPVTQKHCVPLK